MTPDLNTPGTPASMPSQAKGDSIVETLERRRSEATTPAQRAAYEQAIGLMKSRAFKATPTTAVPELIAVVREIVAADPKDAGWNIYLAELLYTAEDFGISDGAALREEAKPMIVKLTSQFPNEQKPYIFKSWVCEDKSGFTANCMQDLVQCLRVNPQNNECRRSLQSMAAGYQAPRCDAATIKPSLVFREINSTSTGPSYSIPARSLLDEVISRPPTPNTNTDPGVLANLKRGQLDGYSNCTERLAHSEVGEVGLFDGKKKLFSAHPKKRINTWRMQFPVPIADICAQVEQRRLPDDVAQALAPAQ